MLTIVDRDGRRMFVLNDDMEEPVAVGILPKKIFPLFSMEEIPDPRDDDEEDK
jgi:hypothetical protein